MSRIEVTHNRGPEVVTSGDESITSGTNFYSRINDVRLYTLHSYHVVTDDAPITFTILASNISDSEGNPSTDFSNDWTVISTHSVSNGQPLAYSDIWNFNFSCVLIQNTSGTTTQVRVFEKHNA